MKYGTAETEAAQAVLKRFRLGRDGELGAALAVVGLSAERADKEVAFRDDMIRMAHTSGASLREIAQVSGLGRKTVTAIVAAGDAAAA